MDILTFLAGFYVGTSIAGFAMMYLIKVPLQRKLSELSEKLDKLQPMNETTKGELTTEAPLPTCKA